MSYPTPQELRAMAKDKSLDIGTAWNALAAAAERIETLEADMFETTDAVIGHVTPVDNGWEVAFAPDCTTWITVRRDEHDEPKVGDFITVTVPKAVAIHSQPNPTLHPPGCSAAEPR